MIRANAAYSLHQVTGAGSRAFSGDRALARRKVLDADVVAIASRKGSRKEHEAQRSVPSPATLPVGETGEREGEHPRGIRSRMGQSKGKAEFSAADLLLFDILFYPATSAENFDVDFRFCVSSGRFFSGYCNVEFDVDCVRQTERDIARFNKSVLDSIVEFVLAWNGTIRSRFRVEGLNGRGDVPKGLKNKFVEVGHVRELQRVLDDGRQSMANIIPFKSPARVAPIRIIAPRAWLEVIQGGGFCITPPSGDRG